ncbi:MULTISPECIES: TRAP transporter small permease subunit [unclassified Chelatococcus]|uniref:TRAP transporter small permease subunit n=1 Tax=unclassified Chelatococcus TaxID=2638111 RepID=UPI001BD0584E|nr:TRAP transporter small permease subunit [Chelatococcus sp.]MBS7698532.1 TRAP transporter small permease subunit [Chelatococcus sp. YT9]MBX3554817.1 TRAP transporter small permease subunit [Chelatococcus sp.]
MSALLAISRIIDAINTRIGKWCAWLILAAIVVSALNAIVRKLLDTSSNAWLELQWVLFGVVFLMCAPWTLIANEHIRIDIINGQLSKRVRDWIDIIGHVFFLLPFTIVMIVTTAPFAERSWLINEQSSSAGGLPQWPAKFLILVGFVLLFFQAVSELIKRIAIMRGAMDDPHAGSSGQAEAEVERLLENIDPHSPSRP